MRTLLTSWLVASVLGLGLGAAACSRTPDPGSAEPVGARGASVATVSVDQLAAMLDHHDCVPVDANGDVTRRRMGVIPGAVLLRDMDAVDQLPADRTRSLVFYCANTACGASHQAAETAIAAGYRHVQVLPDGIAGWVKAGKPTRTL